MVKKIYLFFLLILFNVTINLAQDKPGSLSGQDADVLDDAEFLYDEGNYIRALPLYLKLNQKYPKETYYKYKAGICYLYKTDEREKSITFLEDVKKNDPSMPDIDYYLGRAYRINYKFDEAIETFNNYIKGKGSDDLKEKAKTFIEYAENGKKLTEKPIEAEIKNVGTPVNTEFSEYTPVISADESVLIFTYRGELSKGGLQSPDFKADPGGEYYEDIFISYRVGDSWTNPESIGDNINTNKHDASIALSADGQKLFIFKSDKKNKGDIYMSSLVGDTWSPPVALGDNINSSSWEGSVSLSADEQTLYFSSERPGGLGGRDIYKSTKQKDGSWGKAENLGPTINTKLNDDAPFIHPDGISLYFSSEGHNSMGNYDIFYSLQEENGWSAPINFGYPVNTTGDDIYYVLAANGKKGYYSSAASGGFGQQDIYTVVPGVAGIQPILALVKGFLYADLKPIGAMITVTNADNGEIQGTYQSNASTGKFLLALAPGKNYKVAFEVEGYQDVVQYVNVKSLDSYVEVIKDLHMYSEQYQGEKLIDSVDVLQQTLNQQIEKSKAESSVEAREKKVYQDLVQKKGDVKEEGVEYYLNLGAYHDPKQFNAAKLSNPEMIDTVKGNDGISRMLMGPYKTLLEVEIAKARLIQQDSTLKNVSVKVNDKGVPKDVNEYYAEDYKKANLSTDPKPEKVIGAPLFSGKNPNATERYLQILNEYGAKEIEGLSFKLEVTTLKNKAGFDFNKLKEFGEIEAKTYADGSTRYTLGPFKTLAEAEMFKQKVIQKYPEAAEAFVTVFHLGELKTVEKYFDEPVAATPCSELPFFDFEKHFDGKDLNDPKVYNDLIDKGGKFCAEGLIFRVQIGAYRHPKNFKYSHLKDFEPALIKNYPDGVTRFTMREFKTLKEAEKFRQQVIKKGTRDAWITGEYKGERKLLQELIKVNFYNRRAS